MGIYTVNKLSAKLGDFIYGETFLKMFEKIHHLKI